MYILCVNHCGNHGNLMFEGHCWKCWKKICPEATLTPDRNVTPKSLEDCSPSPPVDDELKIHWSKKIKDHFTPERFRKLSPFNIEF